MRQVSEIRQLHKATHKGAHSNNDPMAIRIVGVGYNGPIPNDGQVVEIPSSWYRLLHQMGRSRSLGHNHREKCAKLCNEKHYLQIWYTKGVGLRQWEAVRQRRIQRLLLTTRDQEPLLLARPPVGQQTG